jgi:hypothetical protein
VLDTLTPNHSMPGSALTMLHAAPQAFLGTAAVDFTPTAPRASPQYEGFLPSLHQLDSLFIAFRR